MCIVSNALLFSESGDRLYRLVVWDPFLGVLRDSESIKRWEIENFDHFGVFYSLSFGYRLLKSARLVPVTRFDTNKKCTLEQK